MNNIIEKIKNMDSSAKRVIYLLQKHGALTKNEICLLNNMKLSTLNRVMKPLLENKIIGSNFIGESSGGRKPVLYGMNLCRFYVIGIDISRLYTRVVITNVKMEILYSESFKMDETCTPDETINRIEKIINKAYKKLRLDYLELLGIGAGVVGPFRSRDGIILNPVNFMAEGWNNVSIKRMLEDRFNCFTAIENGAGLAALSEYLYGIGKNIENITCINCGIGIRTGTVLSGKLVKKINASEDAFGHMVIEAFGEKCSCGNNGCIECYSSVHAVINRFKKEIKKGKNTIINKALEKLDIVDICSAAEKNDKLCRQIIADAGAMLGIGLANYINLFDPELIILSGPLVTNSKLFYDSAKETALKKLCLHKDKKVIFSRGGQFKENAISLGAAAFVIESLLSDA